MRDSYIIMALRFRNFSKIITQHEFQVLMTEEEFIQSRNVRYKCLKNHISELDENSFRNKTAPSKMKCMLSLCGKCNEHLTLLDKLETKAGDLGFKIMELEEDNLHVTYKCGCGAVNKSDTKSICRSSRTSSCPKCQNNPYKLNFDDVVISFEARGCRLLTRKEDFKNNKQLLEYICSCGSKGRMTYHALCRGRLCLECRVMRSKETSMERYGTDNPSKSDIIKQRIVDTNVRRHGVEYAMQLPAFFRKAQQTSFQRRKYVSPFGDIYMIMGYEDMCLDEIFEVYGDIQVLAGEDENIPVISYISNDGKEHTYYPDIYIPSLNMLLEVKSTYRYEQEKDAIIAKAEASSKLYDFQIVIYKNRRSDGKVFQGTFDELLKLEL